MENLHLKNLIQKPNGLVILKKFSNPNNNYKNELPMDLIKYINEYVKSLTFKNENIKKFINQFLTNLITNRINNPQPIPIQIITLLYKYKINEFDIGSTINFDEINEYINANNPIQLYFDDNIRFEYNCSNGHFESLTIKLKDNTNEIKQILHGSL
jgi:hypothetical protein